MKKVFGFVVVAILAIGFTGCEKADPEMRAFIDNAKNKGWDCEKIVDQIIELSADKRIAVIKKFDCEKKAKEYEQFFGIPIEKW